MALNRQFREMATPLSVGKVGNWEYFICLMSKGHTYEVFRRDLPADMLEDSLGQANTKAEAEAIACLAMKVRRRKLAIKAKRTGDAVMTEAE